MDSNKTGQVIATRRAELAMTQKLYFGDPVQRGDPQDRLPI